MDSDSSDGRVPLTEALRTWSDPRLVAAVRAAENRFRADVLEELGRDRLDALADRSVTAGRRARWPSNDEERYLIALDRAWEALLDAFRLMVARREINLYGSESGSDAGTGPQPLGAVPTHLLRFDVRGGAVAVDSRTYRAVTASQKPPAYAARVSVNASQVGLHTALVLWCNPGLLSAVMREERLLSATTLARRGQPQFTPPEDRRPPPRASMLDEDDLLAAYSMAWSALQRDFQARMARGEFHLAGVQTRPERTTEPRPIPGVWAADCRFDFLQDIVFVGDMRFVAVTAAGGPMAEKRQVAGPADAQLAPLLPERVADLDPDTVAALLEAHADHVRRGLRIQLLPPGKASPLALAASMMRHRGLTGALYDTLEAEAEWLAVWLARVAPSYFPTKAKALSNKLGRLYKDLKAGGDGSWEPGDLSDC